MRLRLLLYWRAGLPFPLAAIPAALASPLLYSTPCLLLLPFPIPHYPRSVLLYE